MNSFIKVTLIILEKDGKLTESGTAYINAEDISAIMPALDMHEVEIKDAVMLGMKNGKLMSIKGNPDSIYEQINETIV